MTLYFVKTARSQKVKITTKNKKKKQKTRQIFVKFLDFLCRVFHFIKYIYSSNIRTKKIWKIFKIFAITKFICVSKTFNGKKIDIHPKMSIPSSLVSSIENITSEFTFRYSVYLSNTKKKLLCGSSRKSLTIPNQLSWKSEKAKNWLSNSITQFFWFLSVWLNT